MTSTRPRSVKDILNSIPSPMTGKLPAPPYTPPEPFPDNPSRVLLMNKNTQRHMTNEGWQLAQSLQRAGYILAGKDLTVDERHTPTIVEETKPNILVMQDKREWEGKTALRGGDMSEAFLDVQYLKSRPDIFKLTILKDAHQKTDYHMESAREIGCHAWLCYYHPDIVTHLSPFVRREHIVRIYHSIDSKQVPPYSPSLRRGCVVSGALSKVYPLRNLLARKIHFFRPETTYLQHPGYHAHGSVSHIYLKTLSRFMVSVATSSIYGYALRKIIESTAAGCKVITDLPKDDVLPEIDGNLVRVSPHLNKNEIKEIIQHTINSYNPEEQHCYAAKAKAFYDWRVNADRLNQAINSMRTFYNVPAR